MGNEREIIARRAAKEIKSGMIINLGIGIPSLVSNYLISTTEVIFQSENGLLGMGASPKHSPDGHLTNAGGLPTTILPQGSYFDSSISFAMIRSGKIDLAIMGTLQVSARGDLANWIVPGKRVPGVGGAMDLSYGANKLMAVMTHTDKYGNPKILENCTLPITGYGLVSMIITEKAVFSIYENSLILEEILEGSSLEDIQNTTEASFIYRPK